MFVIIGLVFAFALLENMAAYRTAGRILDRYEAQDTGGNNHPPQAHLIGHVATETGGLNVSFTIRAWYYKIFYLSFVTHYRILLRRSCP